MGNIDLFFIHFNNKKASFPFIILYKICINHVTKYYSRIDIIPAPMLAAGTGIHPHRQGC